MTQPELRKKIEYEIHTSHIITDSTYNEINNLVQQKQPEIDYVYKIDTKYTTIVAQLDPFNLKLVQFLLAAMEKTLPEMGEKHMLHGLEVILFRTFKFFPDEPCVYLAWCVWQLLNNMERFTKQLQSDVLLTYDNNKTIASNIGGILLLILLVSAFVTIGYRMMHDNNEFEREIKSDSYKQVIEHKNIKPIK